MSRYAYLATAKTVALMQGLSRLRVRLHNREYLPGGSVVFAVNRFALLETLVVPYHIYRLTGKGVWSQADAPLFDGALGRVLAEGGACPVTDPDRDRLMVQSLLTGEANWIIYPDPPEDGKALLPFLKREPSPYSGAAALALRTEFYRQRLTRLSRSAPGEAAGLCSLLGVGDPEPAQGGRTWLLPVNVSCYPLRARQKVANLLDELCGPDVDIGRAHEILREGNLLFSAVDIDICFAPPVEIAPFLAHPLIQRDIRRAARIGFDEKLPSLPLLRRACSLLSARCAAGLRATTTLNHDHLFAALLHALPFPSIGEEEFRRRGYLLAGAWADRGARRHRSLEKDQVALLTDDRHHRYRDFIHVAAAEGAVVQREGRLVKEGGAALSFLRRPGGDPGKVAAGVAAEALSLKSLQREARKVAWLPEWLVRRLVAQRVERQALAEFEDDYRLFSRSSERKGRDIGAPILLKGRTRSIGVVLVHGFLAAPAEVAELARYLHEQGVWVYLVRLKGHGTAPEDLALRSRKDWMESVDRGYALMKGICRSVVLGGFSFGGGVALDCASRVRDVAGVFAVCPPHRLMDISSRFVPAVTAWNRVMGLLKLHAGKMEYARIAPERPQINYGRLPICAVRELERFMKQLERKLAAISVPTLVVQADGDPVVDPRGSRRLFDMLGSFQKEYRIFPRRRHGILAGEGAEEVHAVIAQFVKQVAAAAEREAEGRGAAPARE